LHVEFHAIHAAHAHIFFRLSHSMCESVSDLNSLCCRVPSHLGTGNHVLRLSMGSSYAPQQLAFTYSSSVVITSVTSSFGCVSAGSAVIDCPVIGGAVLTIHGNYFGWFFMFCPVTSPSSPAFEHDCSMFVHACINRLHILGTNSPEISIHIGQLVCPEVTLLVPQTTLRCTLPSSPTGGLNFPVSVRVALDETVSTEVWRHTLPLCCASILQLILERTTMSNHKTLTLN
jgi:hypothetical protein